MALLGFGLILVALVFAGMAMAPLFNVFLPPERKVDSAGCGWIIVSGFATWAAMLCFFSVHSFDPNQPDGREPEAYNMGGNQ